MQDKLGAVAGEDEGLRGKGVDFLFEALLNPVEWHFFFGNADVVFEYGVAAEEYAGSGTVETIAATGVAGGTEVGEREVGRTVVDEWLGREWHGDGTVEYFVGGGFGAVVVGDFAWRNDGQEVVSVVEPL